MITLCSCGAVVRVSGQLQDVARVLGPGSSFYPNRYSCPRCQKNQAVYVEKPGPEMLMGELGVYLFELPLDDALRLHMGLGLPDECHVDEAAVAAALQSGVAGWELETDDQSGRPYVKTLQVSDGRTLYFGAGPLGAVIYRIARKPVSDEVGSSVQS